MSGKSKHGGPRHRETGNLVLFPDRENTGNFVVTGKIFETQENIFDCIYYCKKHVSLHLSSNFF